MLTQRIFLVSVMYSSSLLHHKLACCYIDILTITYVHTMFYVTEDYIYTCASGVKFFNGDFVLSLMSVMCGERERERERERESSNISSKTMSEVTYSAGFAATVTFGITVLASASISDAV